MIDEKILVDKLKGRKETVLCKENYLFGNVGVAHAEGFNRGLEYAIAVVNQLAEESKGKDTNVPSNNGWIPCSERLPKIGERVLVCTRHGDVFVSHTTHTDSEVYKEGTCHIFLAYHNEYVIAWMPLPAPFKPKK